VPSPKTPCRPPHPVHCCRLLVIFNNPQLFVRDLPSPRRRPFSCKGEDYFLPFKVDPGSVLDPVKCLTFEFSKPAVVGAPRNPLSPGTGGFLIQRKVSDAGGSSEPPPFLPSLAGAFRRPPLFCIASVTRDFSYSLSTSRPEKCPLPLTGFRSSSCLSDSVENS